MRQKSRRSDGFTTAVALGLLVLVAAGGYLLNYANTVVDEEVARQDLNDVAKSSAHSLAFDPTGARAGGLFEKTGTLAVLHEERVEGEKHVPTDKVNEYCWSAELTPSFVLEAAKKAENDDCVMLRKRDWLQVSNNYPGFILNAVGDSRSLGPRVADDMSAALNRYATNGIAQEACFK